MFNLLKLFSKNKEITSNKPIFKKHSADNDIEVLLNNKYYKVRGLWPLVDENFNLTEFLAVGDKNGIPKKIFNKFKKEYKNKFKYIYNCQSSGYLTNKYKYILRNFDGVFDLDFSERDITRSLYCNHSMMVRSMPYENFFWEPIVLEKPFDFSILTWGPSDKSMAKRWDRGEKICEYMLNKGLKGIVVTARGSRAELISNSLITYVENGSLVIENGNYSDVKFHELMCNARYSIFPNNLDAFPKHIIESLLADKPVIISKDLLLGQEVLSLLNDSVRTFVDFEDEECLDIIFNVISKKYVGISPRKSWLKRYNFLSLSEQWGKEFNRLFGSKYERLFFMNHISRVKENKLLN